MRVNACNLLQQSWFRVYWRGVFSVFLKIVIFVLGYFVFSVHGLIFKILGLLLLSFAFYSISVIGIHSSGHNSLVRSFLANRVLCYFFADLWAGLSSEWWIKRHSTHHQRTGIPAEFRKLPALLVFLLSPFAAVAYVFVQSVRNSRKQIIFLLLFVAGFLLQLALFLPAVELHWAFIAVIIMRSLFAPVVLYVALHNHDDSRIYFDSFLTFFGGNDFLRYHKEHHRRPCVPASLLPKIYG
ncbi:fatty acid desaturase [Candidatus Woesearchaeota archaeon]|nr:fatty acid desaturase [Candidatus Woesearchaeota archaeon]